MALFSSGLLPASFRGVPFAVENISTELGRRIALHQYPGRDDPWAEDMGRGARRYRFRGFIVTNDLVYLGGPIQVQRLALAAVAEAKGSGVLTHPTLGLLTVVCESCAISEALDAGTYSTVDFSFVEAGKQGLPSLLISSLGISTDVITALAVAADAVRAVALLTKTDDGSGALQTSSTAWTGKVSALGADATALTRLAANLAGNFGRYSRGATQGYLTTIDTTSADTLPQLVELAAGQRAAIAQAAGAVDQVVNELTVTTTEQDYADAAAALVSRLASACADPADALRLLDQLLNFTPTGLAASTDIGEAVAGLYQLLVVLEIVRAIAGYEPASYDDAFAKLVYVTGVIDDAILRAGDAGEDDLFAALRALRVTVVADLKGRGASLTHIREFVLPGPLPALALAQRLYRDAARADELVGEADCVSPLFMPTRIRALAA
jgi:prophage DNA circulation protein